MTCFHLKKDDMFQRPQGLYRFPESQLCTNFGLFVRADKITRQQKRNFILSKATYKHSSKHKFLGYMMLRITLKRTCAQTWICLYFLWRAAMINPSSVHATISRASRGKLPFSITRLWYLPAWNGLQDKRSVFCIKASMLNC